MSFLCEVCNWEKRPALQFFWDKITYIWFHSAQTPAVECTIMIIYYRQYVSWKFAFLCYLILCCFLQDFVFWVFRVFANSTGWVSLFEILSVCRRICSMWWVFGCPLLRFFVEFWPIQLVYIWVLFTKIFLLNFESFGQFNWRSVCRRIRTDVTGPQAPSAKSDGNFA